MVELDSGRFVLVIDLRQLRVKFWSTAWAPAGELGSLMPTQELTLDVEQEEGAFYCDLIKEDGSKCTRPFETRHALLAHQRMANDGQHGYRSLAYQVVKANQCPICSTVLADKLNFQRVFHFTDFAMDFVLRWPKRGNQRM